MIYRDTRRRSVSVGEVIGRGGEATIYKVTDRSGILAKIYARSPTTEYARKLVWMRSNPPNDPTASQNHASLAWPVDLLYSDTGQLVGYLMPHIERAVPLLDVFNPRRCAEVLPEFNRRYLHRTARNLAAALGALHARGYVVGDINESNILVTPSALVTMIDTDSFQVREPTRTGALVHTCPVARLEYTPPELQGKSLLNTERSPEQDAFGLGVLIYQLLMRGNHPFRAQWLGTDEPPPMEERIRRGCFPYRSPPICPVAPPPFAPSLEILHPAISRLVLQCFTHGHRNPRRRPSPDLWERALDDAEKSLTTCRNGHYYSNHLSDCPVCHPRPSSRQIPLPPISELQPSSSPATASSSQPVRTSSQRSSNRRTAGSQSPSTRSQFSAWFGQFVSSLLAPRPFRLSQRYARRTIGFTRQSVLDSLWKGALWGAGAGALGGGLLAFLTWVFGSGLRWTPLLVVGASLAAAWRSLPIGLGSSYTIMRTIGWEMALKVFLTLVFVGAGGLVGWLMMPALQAVGLGILMGGLSGWLIGDALWDRSPRFRWDLVGTAAVILIFAWLAYLGSSWLGSSWLGITSANGIAALAEWAVDQNIDRLWISTLVGILGGGLGGALSGAITETLAELTGFRR